MTGRNHRDFVDLAQQLGCRGDEQQFERLLDAVLRTVPGQDALPAARDRKGGRLEKPELIVEIGHPRAGRRVERERGEGREIRDGT